MHHHLFASRARTALSAAIATLACLVAGASVALWVRSESADVGVDLLLFVGWLLLALVAAAAQALLLGDLFWGARWRRRAVLGWSPQADDVRPDDLRDRRALVGLVLAVCLATDLAGTELATGRFFQWYQRLGFAVVQSRDTDPAARLEALVALTEVDDPRAEAVAAALVRDEDREVRGRAVWIAGERRLVRALPDVLDTLEAPDEASRAVAAEALGKLGGEGARDALLDLLSRPTSPELRRAALAGLGLLGDPGVRHIVAAELAPGGDERVRATALWALGELGGLRLTHAVVATEPHGLLRCAGVHALARALDGQPAALPPALGTVFPQGRGTRGPDCPLAWITPAARDHCAPRQVQSFGMPYEGDCNRYLVSSPEPFRLKLVRALARVGGQRAKGWLARVYNDDHEEPLVRTRALDSFMSLDAELR